MMDTSRNGNQLAILAALAARLRDDPQFMAHVLSTYQQLMGLDDYALARELRTRPEMMVRLALCKSPDVTSASYERDLRDLSDYTLADERVLSQVIRRCCRPDGGVQAATGQVNITGPRRLWRSCAELLGSPFRSALTLVCSVGLLLIVGSLLLWRQSMNIAAPPLVAAVPSIDAPQTDPPQQSQSSVLRNGSDSRGMPSPSGLTSPRAFPRRQQSERTVMVDLERTTLRDAVQPAEQPEKILRLPLSRTALLLKLVDGSRPGEYLISVNDAHMEPVFSVKKSSPRGRFLKAVVDTRGMLPGEYSLCVRRESLESELPDCVPVLIDASISHINKVR